MDSSLIRVDIVYALPARVISLSFALREGAQVGDALAMGAQHAEFAEVDLAHAPVGIFGKLVPREQLLRDGDRVEIYRPLAADPKVARRTRSARRGTSPRQPQ
jgi:uncharacterized protein